MDRFKQDELGREFVYWKAPRDMQLGDWCEIKAHKRLLTVMANESVKKGDEAWFVIVSEDVTDFLWKEFNENPELLTNSKGDPSIK